MKLAFIHPDLGIGGAEQLVVNLCLAIKAENYEPHIFTPYHHKSFPQTHDGTIYIHQHGSFFNLIPATIFGRFKAILAYLRTFLCCLWMVLFDNKYDVVVADQVSIVLPLLRLTRNKTIFYCHFPDKLLAGGRKNWLKKIYRFFLDLTEEICLIFAHKIYVNSEYTKGVFYDNFPILKKLRVKVQVLYPAIDFTQFDLHPLHDEQINNIKQDLGNCRYFFSLNRYQRKKNINLALKAYQKLLQAHPQLKNTTKLVIAGGYDLQVEQNVNHLIQLKQLAKILGIQKHTLFYQSVSQNVRHFLLNNAECVLYTPQNEHFGIVPIQAMYCNIPIIADNSGGPKQSVSDKCGYLVSQHEQEWGQKMWIIYNGQKDRLRNGKQHVISNFGFEHFKDQFLEGIHSLKLKEVIQKQMKQQQKIIRQKQKAY